MGEKSNLRFLSVMGVAVSVYEQFENKLPQAETSKKELDVFVRQGEIYVDELMIHNVGGGTLEGQVYFGPYIESDKTKITGNMCRIKYKIDLSHSTTKTLYSEIVFATNGGEVVVKVTIHVGGTVLSVEGHTIETLADFYQFCRKNQSVGKKIFVHQEFLNWLGRLDYAYIDIYEQFRKDPIKERGINNFFVFNKFKENPKLVLESKKIELIEDPFRPESYQGELTIRRMGWGFVDERLMADVPWIKLEKQNVLTADFKDSDNLIIPFTVPKENIYGKNKAGKITLSHSAGAVDVRIKMLKILEVEIDKNYQTHKDVMYLCVKNNTKDEIRLEVQAKDAFVKFEEDNYLVGEMLNIPFNIKLSTLQLAQKSIKKVPVFESWIRVKATYKDKKFFEDIKIVLGDFN